MALRKIGIAMIGVFGSAMEDMQVSLTLMLVLLAILCTSIAQPYGQRNHGELLQRLEVATLCLLILTLWAASVFSIYPKCEVSEGKSLWWCDALSVIIGLADAALVVIIFLVFMWLKGAAGCMNRCFGKLAAAARAVTAMELVVVLASVSVSASI